ncbi:MAG: hypothetical protein IJY25_02730 [Bacilli bacterium]|nr:hypothetical protein [Bacilli bacterium]
MMGLLPERIVDKSKMWYTDLEQSYKEITQYDILKQILDKCSISDYKDIKIDTSGEDGLLLVTIKKEKLEQAKEELEKIKKQAEYDEKFLTLREKIGDQAVKYLIGTPIDPVELIKYLPSKELIEKDYELYRKCCDVSCGYYSTDEGLLSIELAKHLAIGKSLDEYPEKLEYHYYWYPYETKQVCEATFTKTEFLESMEKAKQKIKGE